MEINIEKFVQIENIVLWTTLALIVISLILSFVRGYKRGWRYGTFRLVYYVILILIGFCTLSVCANAIGNMYIGNLFKDSYTFTIGPNNIILKPTTLFETIKSFIIQLLANGGSNLDTMSIENSAIALTTSALKLILIFVEGILLATAFNLLGLILWHAIFKHFISKDIRKETYKKGRVVSGFEDLIGATLVLAMIIAPLSSVANSFTQGVQKAESTIVKNEISSKKPVNEKDYELIKAASNAYDESAFAKTFFNWSKDNTGKTYDVKFMEFFTEYSDNGVIISFLNELKNGSEIMTYLVKTGLFNEDMSSLEKAYIVLSTYYGPAILQSVASSRFVTQVLPIAYDLAMNMDQTQKYVGDNFGISGSTYDWSGSIESFSKMLTHIQNGGLCDTYKIEDNNIHVITNNIKPALFTEQSANELYKAFNAFKHDDKKRNLFEDLVKASMVNAALNSNEKDTNRPYLELLPTTKGIQYKVDDKTGRKIATSLNKEYLDLDVSKEFITIYNALYRTINLDDRIASLLLDPINYKRPIDYGLALDIILNNYDEMTKIITGCTSKCSEKTINGKINCTCLLDSDLVMYAYPQFIDLASNTVKSKFNVNIDRAKLIETIYGTDKDDFDNKQIKDNLKRETKHVLSIGHAFNINQSCRKFLLNRDRLPGMVFDSNGKLYSINDDLLDGFISAFNQLGLIQDKSIIVQDMVEEFGKVINEELSKSKTGLITEINTNVDKFGCEIANFLKTYKSTKGLVNYLKQMNGVYKEGGTTLFLAIDGLKPYLVETKDKPSDLRLLLQTIVSSDVLNHQNTNFNTLLNRTFRKILKDDTVEFKSIDAVADCNAIVDILQIAIFDYGTQISKISKSARTSQLKTLDNIDFEKLFAPIDDSKVLSDFFKRYAKQIAKNKFDMELAGANFDNITSWSKEGKNINILFKLGVELGDLKNIDYIHSDPEVITKILSVISSNQLFVDPNNPEKSTFGTFMYEKFVTCLSEESVEYFSNRNLDKNNTNLSIFDKTTDLKEDFEKISTSEWEQEVKIFGHILGDTAILIDGTKSNKAMKPYIVYATSDLCETLKESKAFGRVLSYHIFENIANRLKETSSIINQSNALNSKPLWDAYTNNDYEFINREINCLEEFINAVFDPVYGIDTWKKENGKLGNVSGKYFVEPILSSMVKSVTFNTLSKDDKNVNQDSLTFFEWCTVAFVYEANVYGQQTPETLNIIKNNVKKIDSNPFNNETNNPKRISENGAWIKHINVVSNLIDKF